VRTSSAILFSGAGSGVQFGSGAPVGPVTSNSGGIELTDGDRSVRQSIMLLLSTLPGERVMRPDYGCPLNRLMFWPNDATTAGLAMHYVRQAIRRFEPRVQIVRLDAGSDSFSPERLLVSLEYRIRDTGSVELLETSIALDGEAS
jgi:uncharacterized protein